MDIDHDTPLDKAKLLLVESLRCTNPAEAQALRERAKATFPELISNPSQFITKIFTREFVTIQNHVYDLKDGQLWKINATKIEGSNPPAYRFVGDATKTKHILSEQILDFPKLQFALNQLYSEGSHSSTFPALENAILKYTKKQQLTTPSWNFYVDLLPAIITWACDESQLPPLAPQTRNQHWKTSFTPFQARAFLANSFLLNTRDLAFVFGSMNRMLGCLDWHDLYKVDCKISIHRILCQLCYFHEAINLPPSSRIITFNRSVGPSSTAQWNTQIPLTNEMVRVHTGSMEDSKAPYFVDFANRDLHIGCIIPSMTQEEVLFSTCPEAFVGLLICERMEDNEVMSISNVMRFSHYSGYGHTFRWRGPHPTKDYCRDLLVFDAVMEHQWTSESIYRDLEKARGGFRLCPEGSLVSTGHWGCGAFGGDKTLKFIQQVLAAAVTGVTLDYSTFGDDPCKQALQGVLNMMVIKHMTVQDVVRLILRYNQARPHDAYDQQEFPKFLNQNM